MTQALNRLREADTQMKNSAGQQTGSASKRAADELSQAAGLLGATQQQQATGKLDSLAHESDRLGKEEHAQADRVRSLAAPRATSQEEDGEQKDYAARIQQRNKLAQDRQQLSDDLSQLQTNMRNAARELAPTQPGAASKLRDALGGMDQTDLTNRVQRTADWLRRGINPFSNGTEEGISKSLDQLNAQIHQAQQGMGAGNNQSQPGQETAALDHVERLRSQVESLTARGQGPSGQGSGRQQAGKGQPRSTGSQQGPGGQQGTGSQQGPGGQQAAGGQPNGQPGSAGGSQISRDGRSSDVGNWNHGGGDGGPVYNNLNTGNNHFDPSRSAAAPDTSPAPADPESTFRQSLAELNQLRHLAQKDPAAAKEVQDLVREMQRLDPKRFPGNPELVEQLHTEVLTGIDKLELQLRQDGGDQDAGQIRTTREPSIDPGYEEAVADYYRRLGKGQ